MSMHQKAKKKMILEMCVCLCVSSVCRIVLAISLSHHKRFSSRFRNRGTVGLQREKEHRMSEVCLPATSGVATISPQTSCQKTTGNILKDLHLVPLFAPRNLQQPQPTSPRHCHPHGRVFGTALQGLHHSPLAAAVEPPPWCCGPPVGSSRHGPPMHTLDLRPGRMT